ncbi:excinuclease ABC subunit UvrC [Silvanigrella sp.]|jgi:excinuclease ABC subunit C|uniref:excinuclease ABC subunit UvrC n=1 Tax=Silvanigrella sp. TaxID=2024976 RepID=UPI0037C98CF2
MNLDTHQKRNTAARLKFLREKLSQVPQKPGVYLHKGYDGEILYVGKAKNLISRLKSYFTGLENHTPKTRALVAKIFDFEVIVTENEYESLLLENNLIKHNQPNYNILLRDDKTYPYIKIDINEKWPRVTIVRRRKKDGALYFGPFTISGQVQQLMNVINRFFPLVKCSPTVFKTVSRPCNYYDIKRCLAPCKLDVKKEEYHDHLNSVIAILNSKYKDISKKIKEEMLKAAEDMKFEKAALLRDQIKALESLTSNQSVTLDVDIELDIFGSYWNEELATFYVTNIRDGKVVGGNSYLIRHLTEEPSEEGILDNKKIEQERIFTSFICQYYENKTVPESVLFENAINIISHSTYEMINSFLINKKQDNLNNKKTLFYLKREVYVKSIKHENKNLTNKIKDLIYHSNQNAENKFIEQNKMDENSNQMTMALQSFLNLNSIPSLIECYDISTFQGAETVASQVVFKNAKPFKSGYKKYIIKETVGKADDFASLREVIRRRFKDKEKVIYPDLLILDGGTPQVREVGWVLKSLGLGHLPFIGIAKSRGESNFTSSQIVNSFERLVVPKRNSDGDVLPEEEPETKILKQGSFEFKLVTQLRDEAHRFAITFHRQRRDKSSMKSILLEIKGLGLKRRKKLIDIYPNLKDIAQSPLIEVSEKTNIPLNIIQEIVKKIKEQNS